MLLGASRISNSPRGDNVVKWARGARKGLSGEAALELNLVQ